MVDFDSPSSGLAAAICSGERPLARSDLITPSFQAIDSSVSSTPRLEADSSSSASACALFAEYSTLGLREHPQRRFLQALQTHGDARSSGHAPSGSSRGHLSPARSLGAATVRFLLTSLATVVAALPRADAIERMLSPLSRPRSIDILSARVSLA